MTYVQARAVVLADALPAAFESACLVRCTDVTRRPGRRRPEWHHSPVLDPLIDTALAEFNQKDAAARLAALLTGLGCAASHGVRTGGGRRRYDVQRIIVPDPQRVAAARMLDAAWRQGRQSLFSTDPLGPSAPRHAQRTTLARAVWRAVLLAGGRRIRAEVLLVRLGDHEIAAVLVRAARLLGVTAEVARRPGCFLITVPADAMPMLLGTATTGQPRLVGR
ncbi:hypothetical protein [Actinoplanes sp. NPDC051494]|uniref:hypothetical protein n=1 Tax=Actinoplanes sp. NPDC051494 TaxID=3363907 RepID=UPI0037B68A3F